MEKKDSTAWQEADPFQANSVSMEDPLDRRLANRDASLHRRRKSGKQKNGTGNVSYSPTKRSALLEIPLCLSEKEGISLQRNSTLDVSSSFHLADSLQGGVAASTHMRGRTGYTSGRASMSYRFGSLGAIRTGIVISEPSPQVLLGGTCNFSPSSSLSSTFQTGLKRSVPADDLGLIGTSPRASFSLRHSIDPRFTLNTSCVVDPSRKTSNVLQVNLLSRTVHRWNIGLGWNYRLARPLVSATVMPQLFSPYRFLRLSASWRADSGKGRPMTWSVSGAIIQQQPSSLPPMEGSPDDASVAKVSVGISQNNSGLGKGLRWIFSWTQGAFTLRVPVTLSSLAETAATNVYWYPLQALYFSVLSCIVQDVVADLFNVPNQSSNRNLIQQQRQEDREKSRQDATQQQEFMKRQAESKRTTEAGRDGGGLLIERAVYHIDGGDQWDVTVPLQFWVSDSSLELPASSKKSMLGFYDVSASTKGNNERSGSPSNTKNHPLWWKGFWTAQQKVGGSNANNSTSDSSAKLSVQYKFCGKCYEITVLDHEELVLPSNRAALIADPEK